VVIKQRKCRNNADVTILCGYPLAEDMHHVESYMVVQSIVRLW